MKATTLDWATFVAAVAAAVGALAAAAIYAHQARIMNKTRIGANLVEVVRLLQSPPMRENRRAVYAMELTPEELAGDGHVAVRHQLEEVAQTFSSVGLMYRTGMLPPKEFMANWDWGIVRLWTIAAPWILHRRGRGGEPPDLWHDFEELARQAGRSMKKRGTIDQFRREVSVEVPGVGSPG